MGTMGIRGRDILHPDVWKLEEEEDSEIILTLCQFLDLEEGEAWKSDEPPR